MGMSAIERRNMRSELGMIPGERCKAGAFYELLAAWMREILGENEHLNKEMLKFYNRAGELSGRVRELESRVRELESRVRELEGDDPD